MNYQTMIQWGGNQAPWNGGGIWVLGALPGQIVVGINITSADGAKTYTGTVTYLGQPAMPFNAIQIIGNTYGVQGTATGAAPWNGGDWVIGGRDGQRIITFSAASTDGGKTLVGQMEYAGSGGTGFTATAQLHQHLNTLVQPLGSAPAAPWHKIGTMVLSSREPQQVASINIASTDHGKTFNGIMAYDGEGGIAVRCTQYIGNTYTVENQWGGDYAPWNPAGMWLIGARDNQRVVALNVSGHPLVGTITYDGEAATAFKSVVQG